MVVASAGCSDGTPSACDSFRKVVDQVQAGDQDATSQATIDDLALVADKAIDEGGDVGEAGLGLRITLDTIDDDPNAEEHLASSVRLLDDACSD